MSLHEQAFDHGELVDALRPCDAIGFVELLPVDGDLFAPIEYRIAELCRGDELERLLDGPFMGGEGGLFDVLAVLAAKSQVLGAGLDLGMPDQVLVGLLGCVLGPEPGELVGLGASDVGGEVARERFVLLVRELLRRVESLESPVRIVAVEVDQAQREYEPRSMSVTTGSPSLRRSSNCCLLT